MAENASVRGEAQAKNEELFRDVNERIEGLSRAVEPRDLMVDYLCECDRRDCYERVSATREEYEAVRAVPTHFIVVGGHEDARVERVVLTNERFLIVEKQGRA